MNHKKKKRLWPVVCLICALAVSVFCWGGDFSYASEAPEEGDAVRMEVIWNERVVLRNGQKIPFTVQVTAYRAVQGTVSMKVLLENGQYYAIEEQLALEAGETGAAEFRVPITYSPTSFQVTYTGADGTVYGMEQMYLNPALHSSELYIGAVSDDTDRFDWCAGAVDDPNSDISVRISYLTADQIPEEYSRFEYYDILILDGAKASDFSDRQLDSIDRWVRDGGCLLIGNDSDLCGPVDGGEVRREACGAGMYVFCGYSFESLGERMEDQEARRTFFRDCFGLERWEKIQQRVFYGNEEYWNAMSMTPSVDADRIPNVLLYALVLLLYLVLIGPVTYFGLKKRKAQGMLRLMMGGIAALFTVMIYLIGSRTRYVSPFASYISLRELSGHQVQETLYLNIQSPYHTEYAVQLSDEYEFCYLSDMLMSGSQGDWSRLDQRLLMQRTESGTMLQIDDAIPFTQELFVGSRTTELAENQGLIGEVTVKAQETEGELTNRTGVDLTNVSVWTNARWIYVGDLPDGATVDLAGQESHSARMYYRPELYEKTTGSWQYNSAVESEEAAVAFWRERLFQYELGYTEHGDDTAKVYGFPAVQEQEAVSDSGVVVRGITVYCTDIPVDYRDGDLTYRADMRDRMTLLSGYLNEYDLATYEQVNIIEYSFGTDELDTLYVEWAEVDEDDVYTASFEGTMQFYNLQTDSYDEMPRKDSYSREELAPYLSGKNSLIVRFEDARFDEYTTEILMPDFSYTGRQMP